MKLRTYLFALLTAFLAVTAAQAAPVLMVSIDGLRPADVIDAPQRGLKLPNLRAFLADGTYASGVRNVLPTVTYPNHTTLVTGVAPALHGISNNTTFDPEGRNFDGWYWYSSDIKVSTLWDAVHGAHRLVASIGWPVTVGNPSIDYNAPEYWRARTADDLKLMMALSTPPGILIEVSKAAGIPFAAAAGATGDNDVARARLTAALIALKKPYFTTLHLVALDHLQHIAGPGSPEANATLEEIDGAVGELVAAARKVEPDLVVAIVSDHGFAPVSKEVNLKSAFVEAGLITYDSKTHRITAWEATPWNADGSAAIVLARPDDQALKSKVAALLAKLAKNPDNGIARVIGRKKIAAMGGAKEASFFVDFRPGYYAGDALTGPLVQDAMEKGDHGYFPTNKAMRATFMIDGPGIAKRKLGEIDMRDIAPTLAKVLEVPLPSATGKALF